jgi:hypothetical protein
VEGLHTYTVERRALSVTLKFGGNRYGGGCEFQRQGLAQSSVVPDACEPQGITPLRPGIRFLFRIKVGGLNLIPGLKASNVPS